MAGIKELKDEVAEMRKSIEKLTEELHETNLAIRESLQTTSDAIKQGIETFSEALENTMERMSDLTIQMNIRDTILKSLGIDGMIPDFLKKKK
jgi:methyl-accepting chemotaxis protein